MKISQEAIEVADCGGYSMDRYKSWPMVAQGLLNYGFTPVEAEAIMRSKWTRWAADASDTPYGQVTFASLKTFMETQIRNLREEVAELVEQTDSLLEE